MNLMFILASIPIVTIGPAWCGLMTSIRYNIRGDGWFAGFKKGFCTRFWRSLIIWCLLAPVTLIFLNDLNDAVLYVNEVGASLESISSCIVPGLFFAMAAMVTISMLTLKRGYGVEPMLRLLSGNGCYRESHNAILDARDELEIMRLLGYGPEAYHIL